MQKTGWTNGSFFLVLSGLVWFGKSVLSMALITRMRSTTIFLCASLFWQTNKQPGDLRASLLLTSEKAVFCNDYDQEFFQSIEKLLSLSRNVLVYLDTLEPIRKLFQFLWEMLSPSRTFMILHKLLSLSRNIPDYLATWPWDPEGRRHGTSRGRALKS